MSIDNRSLLRHLTSLSKSFASTALNLITPRECFHCGRVGAWLCERCTASFPLLHPIPCPLCRRPTTRGSAHSQCRKKLGLEGCLLAADLSNRMLEQLLYGLKYHGLQSAAMLCARLLARVLSEYTPLSGLADRNAAVLCPIPLHPQRARERGYNQADLISNALSYELSLPTRALLTRTRATRDQVKLNRAQRLQNLTGAFEPYKNATLQEEVVFLVDDVVTSGATMHAAASALRTQWPHLTIWGLAVAYHARIEK
ncbi:MAG: hypothetical protein AB1352_00815 [Patescibacteria group bacterium]